MCWLEKLLPELASATATTFLCRVAIPDASGQGFCEQHSPPQCLLCLMPDHCLSGIQAFPVRQSHVHITRLFLESGLLCGKLLGKCSLSLSSKDPLYTPWYNSLVYMLGLKAESGFGDVQENKASCQVSNFELEKEALAWVRKVTSVCGRCEVSYNAPGGRLGKPWSGREDPVHSGQMLLPLPRRVPSGDWGHRMGWVRTQSER